VALVDEELLNSSKKDFRGKVFRANLQAFPRFNYYSQKDIIYKGRM
jgi:hypothetical protein